MTDLIAHRKVLPEGEAIQSLPDHLTGVAEIAEDFAAVFFAPSWGYLAGKLHDLGKYPPEFQNYIYGHGGKRGDVAHAPAGAFLAVEDWKRRYPEQKHLLVCPLAFAVHGHHGSLPPSGKFGEKRWLRNAEEILKGVPSSATPAESEFNLPAPEPVRQIPVADRLYYWECFTRFLFSALVDADRLDTQAFMNPEECARRGGHDSLPTLLSRLEKYLAQKQATAADTPVNRMRTEILSKCRDAAIQSTGGFSLAVPTGGGKTLCSADFALRHAIHNGLRRIIIVIPYTSIIEQNAEEYRKVFGEDNVLEHHSALDPEKESAKNQLAAENWDTPVVVTTSVQFFETLFAARASRVRKLHNIAGSVVIFDEAQTLPPGLIFPTLRMLRLLIAGFRVSVVCCTATQPAWESRGGQFGVFRGIDGMRPLLPDAAEYYRKLQRVRVEGLDGELRKISSWPELVPELSEQDRMLTIVNRRADARELALLLPEETYHLSALMVPAHRSRILAEIKQRLAGPDACRVVATSLVEAGVNVDFPVVYRALAPFDSLAQAAGRCNREGRLPGLGRMVVFDPPSEPLPGVHKIGTEKTRSFIRQARADINNPQNFTDYFRQLFQTVENDRKNVDESQQKLDYPETAKRYRLIEDDWSVPVVIGYDAKAREAIRQVQKEADRKALRVLQRYTVNLSRKTAKDWQIAGALLPLFAHPEGDEGRDYDANSNAESEDAPLLLNSAFQKRLYDERFGLRDDLEPLPSPDAILQKRKKREK